ncbi:CRISPR-associated DxTHG motif protein [Spirosoma sp. KCTC 42546]
MDITHSVNFLPGPATQPSHSGNLP